MSVRAAYPLRVEAELQPDLSRWLWLVKWFLAIPHFVVLALLWVAYVVLTVVAFFSILFTGRYPRSIFEFNVGVLRWSWRVSDYAFGVLGTDRYPPFRLDMGGEEAGGTLTPAAEWPERPIPSPERPDLPRTRWTGGRVVAVVIAAVLVVASLAPLGVGGVALWADRTQRDTAGYVTLLHSDRFTTQIYALASEPVDLGGNQGSSFYPHGLFDTVRIRVTPSDPAAQVFVGIAPASDAAAYLAGFEHAVVTDVADHAYTTSQSGAPVTAPSAQPFWAVQNQGSGTRTLMWTVREGSWTIVVMNVDRSAGVDVSMAGAAKIPTLGGIGAGLVAGGVLVLTIGIVLIVAAFRRARGRVGSA